jgi:cyclopropane fatty-acyl-phospholipid synthase-like methyltransferase
MFSLYVASQFPQASILMINPDAADLAQSDRVIAAAGITNIRTSPAGVHEVCRGDQKYDCIWSISVIEHIAGDYEDDGAVKMMFEALRPGGRLILTTGTDRTAWNEYRDGFYYGSPTPRNAESYFFQRWYDLEAIRRRIIAPIGVEPTTVEWWGEREKGRFKAYEEQALKRGLDYTCRDAQEYAEGYRRFSSWEEMPGIGVCGLLFEKPA